jgi:hypothetical protein
MMASDCGRSCSSDEREPMKRVAFPELDLGVRNYRTSQLAMDPAKESSRGPVVFANNHKGLRTIRHRTIHS